MGTVTEVYRTERGTVWRLLHSEDGAIRVELLKDEAWVPGPIAMAGLRLRPSTTQLTAAAVRKLPI